MRKKVKFKKKIVAMLVALMTFNAMNSMLVQDPVYAAEISQEEVVWDETQEKDVTAATPAKECEGEILETEINAFSRDEGEFTVTLNGGGYSVSYAVYLYNVKELEPAVGTTKKITKIGSNETPSSTEAQWKVKRLDANGNEAKSYFDLSFEELILRHDGERNNSQGWSGVQLKVKFNMDKHTYKITQSVKETEQGRLCLIASEDSMDLTLENRMKEENNEEASESCANIQNKLNAHNGVKGITGYIQCNAYNCGLADYNGDGTYSKGKLDINFNKGKETLKINPNRGTYTRKNGEKITGTSAKELTTKTCGETTEITIPKREGYTFNGWEVTHKTGGNGSYSSSTKKYTHCSTSGTGETTLKAKWTKNGVTNTPTPTPVTEYVQTVKHWCWNAKENKWELKDKDTKDYTIAEGTSFNPENYVKTYDGYYKESITLENGTSIGEYNVSCNTIIHINYKPNQSTLQVDPNGGTWNGSTEVQSFTQAYGTTLEIVKPERDKYVFINWEEEINNEKSSLDNGKYTFGKNAGVTDYIKAQWKALEFIIKYERNEPSGIDKMKIESQEQLNIESKEDIYDIGSYENAKFLGWCLAKGKWENNKETESEELTGVYWLKEDGTFEDVETPKGEKRFDTTGYTGKVIENLASVQELVPYVKENGEELILVGMWTIDVDFDAEDGVNTEALTAGQHDIAPDTIFYLINEAPSLMGAEFLQWNNPTQEKINNVGKILVETGKNIGMLAMESMINLNADEGKNYDKGETVDSGFGKDTVLHATYRYYIQYQEGDGTIIKNGKHDEFEKTYKSNTTISDVTYPTTGNTDGHHYTSEKTWKVVSNNSERYKYADATNYPEKNYSNTYKQGETALVNRSVILRAVEEANTYTVKYNANNTAASTQSLQDWSKMKDQKLTYGQNMTLTDITGSELPGYNFAGWNTKADGTGTSFSNKESNTVKDFLTKAGANVDEDGATINLYAQWKANTYTITFDVNRPSAVNNTHAASNAPVLNGTATMEYVWDSVINNNKIEDLNIPLATLKGWHQRFSDSLWYVGNIYNAQGKAIKNGTRLGYETLGSPGDKTVYAQWEANTYTVCYDGNGKESGGRGIVLGEVKPQTFIYDKSSKLRENTYKKQDENYRYHDDEKLAENLYGTKHNIYASDNFKYYWLGWCNERIAEGDTAEKPMITQTEATTEKIWNFTDVNQGKVVLYAVWDGIPNITTREETTHFERYEGAYLTALDMKKLVKAYDLEQREELEVTVKNISYYEGEEQIETIDNPDDSYVLDTTLPDYLWEDGKYKTYTITFETVDKQGIEDYAIEQPEKQVVYQGKIFFNNEPVIKTYDDGELLYERYFYLSEIEKMGQSQLKEALTRQVKVWDKEDEAYEKDKENDLYLGRLSEQPMLEILQLSNLFQNAVGQEEYWTTQEKEQGKKLQHTIQYTDIFGKISSKTGNIYVIDEKNDESTGKEKEKQTIRFISKEYFDTLEKESQWYKEEQSRKELENALKEEGVDGEVYQLQTGEFDSKTK